MSSTARTDQKERCDLIRNTLGTEIVREGQHPIIITVFLRTFDQKVRSTCSTMIMINTSNETIRPYFMIMNSDQHVESTHSDDDDQHVLWYSLETVFVGMYICMC